MSGKHLPRYAEFLEDYGELSEDLLERSRPGSINLPNDVFIRKAKKPDLNRIMDIFNSISNEDQKFLAYKIKAPLIRQIIKSERHCYVAIHNNRIVGFLRESGRPEGFSLLEEIVVHPEYRGYGAATKLLKYYHRLFHKTMAKTVASNHKMINILTKYGYKAVNPDSPRIINWVRVEE